MRIVTSYICEICEAKFTNETEAAVCEARGFAEELPRGLIECGEPEDRYDHRYTFAVAECRPRKHDQLVIRWACRDSGQRDSLGEEMTHGGGPMLLARYREFRLEWLERPCMKRMVNWLHSKGYPRLVRLDTRIVPLDEAIEELKARKAPEDASVS